VACKPRIGVVVELPAHQAPGEGADVTGGIDGQTVERDGIHV
jgi:hypothetical protein